MTSAGIYIHIPFCAIKCMYCDFYSIADRENSIPKFIEALTQEIEQCEIDVSKWTFDTIFIGGGTPSLLEANSIELLLSSLHNKYNLANIKEITIEANPGEAPKDRLKAFKEMGINRISIGVQSFQPDLLKFLTRIHDQNQIFETYDNARNAGFENINCDLIYSIPGQTWTDWSEDLNTINTMKPEHISAYTLTAEKGTELFSMVSQNAIKMPNKRQESNWFLKTHEFLSNNGYAAYEVSNFSKPGYECIHNLHYWNIDPYLAFGPSAHGYDGQSRWNNVRSLDLYINKVLAGESAISMEEKVSLTNRLNEKIGFGIRMTKGIDLKDIPNKYQNLFKRNIKNLKQKYPNCINSKDTNIFLTSKGMLFADEIIPDMLL